jgi:hypothetical protein
MLLLYCCCCCCGCCCCKSSEPQNSLNVLVASSAFCQSGLPHRYTVSSPFSTAAAAADAFVAPQNSERAGGQQRLFAERHCAIHTYT